MLRVLHLTGSPTDEFFAELSRLYAANALVAAADPTRYEFVVADVSPDGTWRFPTSLAAADLAAAAPYGLTEALARIVALNIDVGLPQLFCRAGMTSYRALLDVVGVPFVGNRPDVMAIGTDKAWTRAVVAAGGVRVPAGEVLRRGDPVTLELPVVVKPADADNSTGVTLVRTPAELPDALEVAFAASERVLVETYVELGREVRCGVLDRGGELVALPLEEYFVDRETHPIRPAADKLGRVDGTLELRAKAADRSWIVDPAGGADPVTTAVWDAARAAHRSLQCRHYSLFDFRIDPDGVPWFLEAGLYNSFATTSVVTVMAGAAGIALPDLFATMLAEALTAPAD